MIRGAAIGARFNATSFDTFNVDATNRAAFDACKRLVAGENDGVVLIGSIGLGKTHLLTKHTFIHIRSVAVYLPLGDWPDTTAEMRIARLTGADGLQ